MGNQSDAPTVRELLSLTAARIRECLQNAPLGSAETPYLDATVLLADAMRVPRDHLLAMMPEKADGLSQKRLDEFVRRRCAGQPVSYIRGKKEFYGNEFIVDATVLVPRPETEHLVEEVLRVARTGARAHVHDCCTGSGAVAISVALHAPDALVTASDIDQSALETAHKNAQLLLPQGSTVGFFHSDLLSGVEKRVASRDLPRPRIICANPPYLTHKQYKQMRESGWPEPERALSAGPDGLEAYRRLIPQAARLLTDKGYLIVEIGAPQAEAVTHLFEISGFTNIEIKTDLGGRDRVCLGRIDGQND